MTSRAPCLFSILESRGFPRIQSLVRVMSVEIEQGWSFKLEMRRLPRGYRIKVANVAEGGFGLQLGSPIIDLVDCHVDDHILDKNAEVRLVS